MWVFRASRLLTSSESKHSISVGPITRPLLSTSDKRLSAGSTCRVAWKAKPFFYKKTYFCDEVTSVESLPTHDRSSLPPFPAPCPGASRIHSALPCYTFPVPTAQHRYHIPAQADSARGRGKPETYGLG